MTTVLEAGLRYLDRGWSVMPTTADKRPAIRSWKEFQSRRATEAEARSWWSHGGGLAVITGKISGIAVLDVEAVGLPYLGELDLPAGGLVARSQRGGLHFYFQKTGILRPGTWMREGVHLGDLKVDGGYVLAPPTQGVHGQYRWESESDPLPLPWSVRTLSWPQISELADHGAPSLEEQLWDREWAKTHEVEATAELLTTSAGWHCPGCGRDKYELLGQIVCGLCRPCQQRAGVSSPWATTPVIPRRRELPMKGLGSYASRSERLMAIARKIVAAGGGEAEVRRAFVSDWAGTKLKGRTSGAVTKYVEHLTEKARVYLQQPRTGEVILGTVIAVQSSETSLGDRVSLRIRLPDGRTVRQGVTRIEGDRWQAFRKALPAPRNGAKVWIEVFATLWNGQKLWRVRRWLEHP